MSNKEIKPQILKDVTLYLESFFGISRIDCRTLEIREGYEFAQYPNAVYLQYVEKGKRKPKSTLITSLPFCFIVATKDAITPDDWKVPTSEGGQESKYTSYHHGYRDDFTVKLTGANVPVIKDYSTWNAHQKPAPKPTGDELIKARRAAANPA